MGKLIIVGLISAVTAVGAADSGSVSLTIARRTQPEMALTWNSQVNVRYNLQSTANLAPNTWRSLAGLVTANGASTTVTDSNTVPQRFYRVVTIQNIITVGETNHGNAITLRAGDILEAVFSENPSTGFRWEYSSSTSNVVALIGEPVHQPGSGIGASGRITYQFEPVGPGQTRLQFLYRRSFDVGVPPAKTVEFNVSVN